MQRVRVLAIVGVVMFGLASLALALVGILLAIGASGMGCPGCSPSAGAGPPTTLYFMGAGLCTVAAVVCGVAIRGAAPRAGSAANRPETNKLGLRP